MQTIWRMLIAAACAAVVAAATAAADAPEQATTLAVRGVYYFGYEEGWGVHNGFAPVSYGIVHKEDLAHAADDPGRDLGYSWGNAGVGLALAHSLQWPFPTGDGPLLEGNSLKLTLTGELSPVSVTASAEAVLTPIAIAEIAAGASAGTGWSIGIGNGLGRNLPGADHDAILAEPFSGLVLSAWLAATLQFDFAALWPGDWHHVIVAAGPKLEYWDFTGAGKDEAWQWEQDLGDNFNGWRFSTQTFVGYRMPLRVQMVGVLVATTANLFWNARRSPMDDPGGWGSDFVTLTIAPTANVTLSDRARLSALVQLRTERDYTRETIGNRYFELRDYDGWFMYLRMVAAIVTWKL